jgi:hypothetical protein
LRFKKLSNSVLRFQKLKIYFKKKKIKNPVWMVFQSRSSRKMKSKRKQMSRRRRKTLKKLRKPSCNLRRL